MTIELDKVHNIKFANVFSWDANDYSDAFIESADFNGRPMTEEELEELNSDREFVHERLMQHLH